MEHWYCIYTKPKMEDHVSRRLMNWPDIEVFNPKLKKSGFSRGRFKEIIEGLFPCYIFLKFNPDRYCHLIKYMRGTKKILGDRYGVPQIVDEEIIQLIKSRIEYGFFCIESYDFTAGEQVVIKEGPLNGLKGIFLKGLNARDRVLILLNTLAYQARIEIDKGFLGKS